jgi:hypothetical protein
MGCLLRRKCKRQRLFASFRPAVPQMRHLSLTDEWSPESAKPFKCLFLKLFC